MTVAEYARTLAAENYDTAANLNAALARELKIQRMVRRTEDRTVALRAA